MKTLVLGFVYLKKPSLNLELEYCSVEKTIKGSMYKQINQYICLLLTANLKRSSSRAVTPINVHHNPTDVGSAF